MSYYLLAISYLLSAIISFLHFTLFIIQAESMATYRRIGGTLCSQARLKHGALHFLADNKRS
jgi:hypothetical protein